MRNAVILVGVGGWHEYTIPAIDSIRKYSKPNDTDIVVIDNGGQYNNEYDFNPLKKHYNFLYLSIHKTVSYANALNKVYEYPYFYETDWYILTNNDVLCTRPFVDDFTYMNPNTLYGQYMHTASHEFKPRDHWLDGWIYIAHRKLLMDVDKWDTNFKSACFEDADFCWRALDLDYSLELVGVPFDHLAVSGRAKSPTFLKDRKHNIKYLCEKYGLKSKIV